MDNEFDRLEQVFTEASQISSIDERTAYLNRTCADNPDLRDRVEKMLKADSDAGGFLKTAMDSQTNFPATALAEKTLAEGPGSTIGEYKLLQKIGEGGFGTVYMAEQQGPIVRKAALKVIKLGMDTEQVVARFEADDKPWA